MQDSKRVCGGVLNTSKAIFFVHTLFILFLLVACFTFLKDLCYAEYLWPNTDCDRLFVVLCWLCGAGCVGMVGLGW